MKHSFVDWRQTLLQKKLEKIQSQQLMSEKEMHINHFFIADLIKQIQRKQVKMPLLMEQQFVIRKIVDAMFEQTQSFQKRLLAAYFFFFFLPFLIQSFLVGMTWQAIVCHALCCTTSVFFFAIELIMIYDDK